MRLKFILAFFILMVVQQHTMGQDTKKKSDVFHLKGEITNSTVQLTWDKHPLAKYDSIHIYRARNKEPLTLHKSIDAITDSFYDDSAVFGNYRYQLKGYRNKYIWLSEVAQIETYGGDDFTILHSPGKIAPGYTFNLILGNAKTNEKVLFLLFDTAGKSILNTEKTLSNQTFYLQTEGLSTGSYVAMLRLENLDYFFTNKFTLEN